VPSSAGEDTDDLPRAPENPVISPEPEVVQVLKGDDQAVTSLQELLSERAHVERFGVLLTAVVGGKYSEVP
jgi:hypothetical protein